MDINLFCVHALSRFAYISVDWYFDICQKGFDPGNSNADRHKE